MDKPPTEKPSDDDFPPSSMKWDAPSESKPARFEFIKKFKTIHSNTKKSNTPGKAIIAAIIVVFLILAYAIVLLAIPASVFYGPDESPMQLDPNQTVNQTVNQTATDIIAQAEEESDSAHLVEITQSDVREESTQAVFEQGSNTSPAIRLIDSPLVIEQHALGRGISP